MTDEVDVRIRACARLSAELLDSPEGREDMARRARAARREAAIDMTEAGIDERLRELASLSALCRSLGAR